MRDFDELRGEMQATVNFVVADVNKEIQALRVPEAAKDVELQAYKASVEALEAQVKLCMATMANMDSGGSDQLSTMPKDKVLQPPTYNGARNQGILTTSFGDLRPTLGQ